MASSGKTSGSDWHHGLPTEIVSSLEQVAEKVRDHFRSSLDRLLQTAVSEAWQEAEPQVHEKLAQLADGGQAEGDPWIDWLTAILDASSADGVLGAVSSAAAQIFPRIALYLVDGEKPVLFKSVGVEGASSMNSGEAGCSGTQSLLVKGRLFALLYWDTCGTGVPGDVPRTRITLLSRIASLALQSLPVESVPHSAGRHGSRAESWEMQSALAESHKPATQVRTATAAASAAPARSAPPPAPAAASMPAPSARASAVSAARPAAQPGPMEPPPEVMAAAAAAAHATAPPAPAVEKPPAPAKHHEHAAPPKPHVDSALQKRAQRYAKVLIEDLELYLKRDRPQDLAAAREKRDLFTRLHEDVDKCRKSFLEKFPPSTGVGTDILEEALIRILCNGDAGVLGPQYRGLHDQRGSGG